MTAASRVAFIGNSLPRHCGIATFTTDLQQAVANSSAAPSTCIVAMTDHGHNYDYPAAVRIQINDDRLADYESAAHVLNAGDYNVACLQHEFGIFGGQAGSHILTLLSRLTMPVVTTLHTVLSNPTPVQRNVLDRIIADSSRVIVMADKGAELLRSVYHAPSSKIAIIPHGTPDVAFVEPNDAKAALGFAGRSVILTFGLLSPSKGIEVMIDAMPAILRSRPDAVYVVLGATHPNLVRDQGEAYRRGLEARARALGVGQQVVFLDQFVDLATLIGFISMCDVYATPYLNEAQMTSGTLAYSFGLGKAIVSTPYWHARELLAHDCGILVPFGDSKAIGEAIATLLTDDTRRAAMRARAYAGGRSMTWPRIAERYLSMFESVLPLPRRRVIVHPSARVPSIDSLALPVMQIGHLLALCDDTGLLQHALYCVPDRSHGYCIDDNARALLVAGRLNRAGERPLPESLTIRFAAFIQHAWNPDRRRFRNFLGYDRRWLEDQGSEDSHGRALWALGEYARDAHTPSLRRWAAALFGEGLPAVERFNSPRAWSFTLLGLDAYCSVVADCADAKRLRLVLADRLMALLVACEGSDWQWFEDSLAYDNARLPQALIVTGGTTAARPYVVAGLRSLRWLMHLQTSLDGIFRPVGSQSFGANRTAPKSFDQQPLEAAATISACLAAWRADADPLWRADAERAFTWFLGRNDLSVPLVDVKTGSCRDGLHPDRANENRGGESAVSYLLGLAEMREAASSSDERVGIEADRLATA
ncbi:MAG TPA: glycosyltransferase family 4 protein [Steroidobacteraceae bacterium]|jgi:glycosyltransferase involved in cell wall biosynthesis